MKPLHIAYITGWLAFWEHGDITKIPYEVHEMHFDECFFDWRSGFFDAQRGVELTKI